MIIGFHELGHALAAHWYGVNIKRISLGFGKVLWRWQDKRGREWAFSLWPFGGYVYLLNSRLETVPTESHKKCFDKKPAWQRIVILLAGAIANLCIAWMAFTLIDVIGYQRSPPITTSGDYYLQVNHHKVRSWQEVGMQLLMNMGKKSVPVLVQNNVGQERMIQLDLSHWHYQPHQKNALFSGLGIVPNKFVPVVQVKGLSWGAALYQAGIHIYQTLWFDLVLLKQLILGVLPISVLMGPLDFISHLASATSAGLVSVFFAIGNISIAVAMINLLPIPGLDGGHILYVLIEKVRGKAMTLPMEQLLYRLAYIVFWVFVIQLVMNDLQRYVAGH